MMQQYSLDAHVCTRIAIVSGRGGVGKTAVTACLGTALARRGKRVLLIDADTGMRCLDIALGLESRVVYDAVDVVEGICKLRQAIVRDGRRPGLNFIAAAPARERSALTPEGLRDITARLEDKYDFMLIDAPTGIEHGFDSACAGADKALLVMTPDAQGIRSAQRMTGLICQRSLPLPGLVINRVNSALIQSGDMPPIETAAAALELDVTALIAQDDDIMRACATGVPLDADSNAGSAFDDAALRLMGENVPLKLPDVRPRLSKRLKRSVRMLRGAPEPRDEE